MPVIDGETIQIMITMPAWSVYEKKDNSVFTSNKHLHFYGSDWGNVDTKKTLEKLHTLKAYDHQSCTDLASHKSLI